ncbi:MAG TPA: TonB family protein [Saprospiraceae bacterium]|nr:TonB family protein [Saprospiraceae bacterium]
MTFIKNCFCIILFLPGLLTAQTLEKIVAKPTNEVYYVLREDPTLRQGPYQKMGKSYDLLVSGFYKNNLRDSIWTFYTGLGRQASTQGKYLKDQRIGLWETFDYNGLLTQQYDYTNKKLLFNKFNAKDQERTYKIAQGIDTVYKKLDRPPVYIGNDIITSLRQIKYPAVAREKSISGTVNIGFVVDTQGKTSGHRVINGIGGGCDEEALRVVKMIPDNWIPGMLYGKETAVEYILPVEFKLE